MGRLKSQLMIVILVSWSLLLTGCSKVKLPFIKTEPPAPQPAGQSEVMEKGKPLAPEAEQAMAAGDYQQALDIYFAYSQKQPDNPKLQAALVAAVETIKKEAEAAKDRGQYSRAISYYKLLVNKFDQFDRFASGLSFNLNDLRNGIKDCQLAIYMNEVSQARKAENYEKAINLLAGALKENPTSESLKSLSKQVVKEIELRAGQALASEDLVKAGKNFAWLKIAAAKLGNLGPELKINLEEVERSIQNCSQKLMHRGLVEYRKGNLKEAIVIWESILSFQPENEEARKAVQTARAQLDKIKGW
ncbi:MAG: tetratricopeptide repeat protein [Candidatus Saccharicenans sp.]